MMNVRAIRNDDDLTWALKEIAPYFDAHPAQGSPDAERFDVLATLIEAYEDRRFPIPTASPLDVLRFAINDLGRTQSELADVLGSRSRASEVLAGKRALTVHMIRAISDAWHIPEGALIGPARTRQVA